MGKFYLVFVCLLMLSMAGTGVAEVKIAILDSGCNIEYEEGMSFVDDNLADLNGHGTAIAEIIRGLNPDAKLYVAKVLGQSGHNPDIEPVVKGIHWAISRQVDLISMSWQIRRDEKILHDAVKKAHRQGIMLIAAAGTEGSFLDDLIDELSRHSGQQGIGVGVKYPARYREVIAIGAISPGYRGRHREYSPVGPEVEFVCDGSYNSQRGTSFAAARAAAIISRLKMDYPGFTAKQLRKISRLYARDLGDKGRDEDFGYGELRYASAEAIETPILIALANSADD